MATRKSRSQEVPPDAPSLKSVLSQGGDISGSYYSAVDGLAIQRLIHTVSALGGMASFWRDGDNERLCLSMRVWGQHSSFNADNAQDFYQQAESVTGKLSKYLQDKKLPPPPPLPPPELLPKPKK